MRGISVMIAALLVGCTEPTPIRNDEISVEHTSRSERPIQHRKKVDDRKIEKRIETIEQELRRLHDGNIVGEHR